MFDSTVKQRQSEGLQAESRHGGQHRGMGRRGGNGLGRRLGCFFFFFNVLFFTLGRPSGLVHLVLSLLVCVCLLPPHRLPDQCDGRPGPAAIPHPPEHRDALEGQARGLQTGQQRPAPSPRHHGGRHAECGLLTPMPPAGKRVRATGVSRMDLL